MHDPNFNRFRLIHPCDGQTDIRICDSISALSMLSRAKNGFHCGDGPPRKRCRCRRCFRQLRPHAAPPTPSIASGLFLRRLAAAAAASTPPFPRRIPSHDRPFRRRASVSPAPVPARQPSGPRNKFNRALHFEVRALIAFARGVVFYRMTAGAEIPAGSNHL